MPNHNNSALNLLQGFNKNSNRVKQNLGFFQKNQLKFDPISNYLISPPIRYPSKVFNIMRLGPRFYSTSKQAGLTIDSQYLKQVNNSFNINVLTLFDEREIDKRPVSLNGSLYCHLSSSIDLDLVKKVDEQAIDILSPIWGGGLMKKYSSQAITFFSARISPNLTEKKLLFSTLFYYALYFGDDIIDEKGTQSHKNDPALMRNISNRLYSILTGHYVPTNKDNKLEQTYQLIREHMLGIPSALNRQYIYGAFSKYLDANVREVEWESLYKNTGKFPDMDEYSTWRLSASGVDLSQMLTCYCHDIDIEKMKLNVSNIDNYSYSRVNMLVSNVLNDAAKKISAFGNDAISLKKEFQRNQIGNYVTIMYKNEKFTYQQCFDHLLIFVNAKMKAIEVGAKDARDILHVREKKVSTYLAEAGLDPKIIQECSRELSYIQMNLKYLKEPIENFAGGCTYWPLFDTERYQ